MKLPGITVNQSVKSLGRLTASGDSGAESAIRKGAAEAQVWGAIGRGAEAGLEWWEADQSIKAMRAVNQYNDTMEAQRSQLKNKPLIAVEDIPDGVKYDKQETLDPVTKETISRTEVPAWEIAPQMTDMIHKTAAENAFRGIDSTAARKAVENSVSDSYRKYASASAAQFLTEKKALMLSDLNVSIDNAVKLGKDEDAKKSLAMGVRNGLIPASEYLPRIKKIENGAEVSRIGTAFNSLEHNKDLTGSQKINVYGGMRDSILSNPASSLTVEQRLAYVNRAGDEIAKIEKAQEKQAKKDMEEKSGRISNAAQLKMLSTGQSPTDHELAAMIPQMTPTDARILMTMAGVVRKSGGAGSTDKIVELKIHSAIGGIGIVSGGVTVDDNANAVREGVNTALRNGKMELKDALAALAAVDTAVSIAVGPKNQAVVAANAQLKANIYPPKSIVNIGGPNEIYHVIGAQAEQDLRNELIKNPKLDPHKWVRENSPRYQIQLKEKVIVKLRSVGLQSVIVTDSSGAVDTDKTQAGLRDLWSKRLISRENFEKGMNITNGVGVASPADQTTFGAPR